MLKGDIRKKQILETSELLFSERGYEATGIQDILNLLHLSKGSFYHHFESKEQVLKIIC
ncbi:MAG: helix-turn-helix transcriptional regulator, partial [Oscillospiraceae bacterium]|nr:helix-turn-helix transcriptional regulator [Oscillospiraceae bacterium]